MQNYENDLSFELEEPSGSSHSQASQTPLAV
jgi:hypothetical protein